MKRLYISIILSVVLGSFVINWSLDYIANQQQAEAEADSELVLYQKLLTSIEQRLSISLTSELTDNVSQLSDLLNIHLELLPRADLALPPSLLPELTKPNGLLLGSEQDSYLLKAINNHPNHLLKVYLPKNNKEQKLHIALTVLLYIASSLLIILWLLPLTRRIYQLSKTANKIAAGDLAARIPTSRFSYIENLEQQFNRMASQIDNLVADNKLLARSLSHDIRTPLACLRFGSEAALSAKNIDKKDQYIERMDIEITRMEKMTSAFLEYASLEQKGFNLNIQQHDFTQLIQQVIDEIEPIAQQKSIQITFVNNVESLTHNLDSHWMYLAIQNILSNGIDYAQSRIVISLSIMKAQVLLSIEDDGKGLPEQDMQSLFDPFAKIEQQTQRDNEHFGLGLATTAKVIDWHQGHIQACQSQQLSGLRLIISLPSTAIVIN